MPIDLTRVALRGSVMPVGLFGKFKCVVAPGQAHVELRTEYDTNELPALAGDQEDEDEDARYLSNLRDGIHMVGSDGGGGGRTV